MKNRINSMPPPTKTGASRDASVCVGLVTGRDQRSFADSQGQAWLVTDPEDPDTD